ncbi:LysR family transcriptional regulator [Herbiconiux sp. YIM B11900]|uniref:LysR family transcriptional regulator n=1 Tax=Herbiconiux sp. YIM B11900 TaxID=3404131 RepID=UPI003F87F736
MPDLLDLVALRSVVEIAEAGSFTAAARSLGISQPAISQHVRGLEQRFGTALVGRAGRLTRFTPEGERVLAEARRLLAAHDEALRSLEHIEAPPIVIGSTGHSVSGILGPLLEQLRSTLPERRTLVRIEPPESLTTLLDEGSIDAGLMIGYDWNAPGDEVGRMPLRWFSARPVSSAAPSAGLPLVVSRPPCRIRHLALTHLARAGRRTNIVAECSDLGGVLDAARAGLGVALLPAMPGQAIDGLYERHDLPSVGPVSVRLVARRGLDDTVHSAVWNAALASIAGRAKAISA